jgi:hypothetical protein
MSDWHPFCLRLDPPLSHRGISMAGGTRKAVAHKTQGQSQSPSGNFGATGYWPHFLIGNDVAYQFLPVNKGGYALKNASGGVETNRGGLLVVQIEVVGFSGVTMTGKTADRLVSIQKWLRDDHGIPWEWPSGRPAQAHHDAAGNPIAPPASECNRNVDNWVHRDGWFGHSEVPENYHWDPAYTDLEWWTLHSLMSK